ncbi:MAG: hypothetical protein BZ138_07830 [Methanosphaera sp. rholeuAM270]|nr:MAG: hypothetical protein BZ138_07830 [Methanosphaera sp. rholeuAM270]
MIEMIDLYQYGEYNIPIEYNENMKYMRIHGLADVFTVQASPRFTIQQTHNFIESKSEWIEKQLQKYDKNIRNWNKIIQSDSEVYLRNHSREYCLDVINDSIIKYKERLGNPNKIFIRCNMSRNWATCSQKHNISFSDNISYVPEHLIEHITYHEMIHLKIDNHPPAFYEVMKEVYPHYEIQVEELRMYEYMIAHKHLNDKINGWKFRNEGFMSESVKILD